MTSQQPRPSIFNSTTPYSDHVEIILKDDELLALIDVVQFAQRMYALAGSSLRGTDNDKADQMEIKASIAQTLASMLIADGDPGSVVNSNEIV
jgi:hypothetical protein